MRYGSKTRLFVPLIVLLLSMIPLPVTSATYTAAVSGNWNITGTWSPPGIPLTGDSVTIPAGRTVTVPGGCSGRAAAVTLNGGNLTFSDPGSLTVSGDLTVGTGSTLSMTGGGTLHVGGALVAGGGSFAMGSTGSGTVDYNGTTHQNVAPVAYRNLLVSNTSAPVTTSGSFTVCGTLTVNSGAILDPGPEDRISDANSTSILTGAGTIRVTRSIRPLESGCDNDFTAQYYRIHSYVLSNLTVQFKADAPQAIGMQSNSSTLPPYGKLSVDNPSGVTLGSSVTVNGQLLLVNGTLTTGSNLLTIGPSGSVNRTNGWVDGNLVKPVGTGSPTVRFEIGSAGGFTPLDVIFSSVTVAGSLRACAFPFQHPAINSSPLVPARSLGRYWTLSNAGTVFASCGATLTFLPADVPSGADPALFTVAKYTGSSAWTTVSTGTAGPASIQATGLTSFSDFAVGEPFPAPPIAPVLSEPANGALIASSTPLLKWQASAHAVTYTLEIAANPDFSSLLLRQAGISGTSWDLSVAPGSIFYWRVTAFNEGGSAASEIWSFGAVPPPAPVTPPDNSRDVSTTPAFAWDAIPGAGTYHFQVSKTPDFTNVVIDQSVLAALYTVPAAQHLAMNRTYFWHVSAVYPIGTSPFSETWGFSTISEPTTLYVNGAWAGSRLRDSVDGHEFGRDAFSSIQSAVNAAVDEDTIWIASGVYGENVSIPKKLTIFGGAGVVVDGGSMGPCVSLSADEILLAGLELRHGTEGISGQSAGLIVNGCRMENSLRAGINLTASDNAFLHGNTINSNGTDGIRLIASRFVTVAGNVLDNNQVNIHILPAEPGSPSAARMPVPCLGAIIQGNTLLSAAQWGILVESDPTSAAVNFNVFGPFHSGRYVSNTALGTLNARHNWFGGEDPPSSGGFGGDVDHSSQLASTPCVAVFPNQHTIPLNGLVHLGAMALIPAGQMARGSSVTLIWDNQRTTLQGGVGRGTFFARGLVSGQQEWFASEPASPTNTLTVDQSIMGGQTGAGNLDGLPYVGTLFTVKFKGIQTGANSLSLANVILRDLNNQTVSPLMIESPLTLLVDPVPPAVASVQIDNVTLNTDQDGDGRDDYVKNGDNTVITASVTDDGPLTAANITADLNGLFGGSGHAAVYPSSYDAASHVASWPVNGIACHPQDGTVTVTVTAADQAGNGCSASGGIIADNTPPAPVTGLTAAPGERKVTLTWTNGSDNHALKGTLIRYKRWNGYPAYDPASAPAYPSGPSSGDGTAGDIAIPVVQAIHIFPAGERDIYLYSAFAYDMAGNFSSADAGSQDRATNYYLGDLGSGSGTRIPGSGGYDGQVNYMDLWWFSNLYYTANIWPYPGAREADIGPTISTRANPANGRFGLPAPDNKVDFEDLMIFSMNYAAVAPRLGPEPDPTWARRNPQVADPSQGGDPALVARSGVGFAKRGEEFTVTLSLCNNGTPVKGCSVELEFNMNLLALQEILAGPLLGTYDQGFFYQHVDGGKIHLDAAILGVGRSVQHSGDLAVMRFAAKSDAVMNVSVKKGLIRDETNNDRRVSLKSVVDAIPEVFALNQNYPNPFNANTVIGYDIPSSAPVSLEIYSLIGERVAELVNGAHEPGRYRAFWGGRNLQGRQVASGIYFCVMRTGGFTCVKKLALSR